MKIHLTEKNCLKAGDFFREFSGFVDFLATSNRDLLIHGDFNIHWYSQEVPNTKCLLADLIQHVQNCTPRQGHILDLVITHECDDHVRGVSVSYMKSDHFTANTEVPLGM